VCLVQEYLPGVGCSNVLAEHYFSPKICCEDVNQLQDKCSADQGLIKF
jgi:hypothetical protein